MRHSKKPDARVWLFFMSCAIAAAFALRGGGLAAEPASDAERFPDIRKVVCVGKVEGCSCLLRPEGTAIQDAYDSDSLVVPVCHAEAVVATGGRHGDLIQVKRDSGEACWYPESSLTAAEYDKAPRSKFYDLDHTPVPLGKFVEGLEGEGDPAGALKKMKAVSLGRYWPTYYHLALEDYHPGQEVDILSPDGEKLGRASQPFLDQVAWEGSGIASDGTRVHVSGEKGRFTTYSPDIWGYGAGYGYQVFPYRTIAVNFPALCEKLADQLTNCTKKEAIGLMVFVPEIAGRGVKMADGSLHDGYFCATDTGSPNYIKSDRIDMFVGTHGGGNPYLPPARRKNFLIDGGFPSLVRSDWRLWKTETERVWCDADKLPKDPFNPQPGDCVYDYHVVAAQKSFEMIALFHSDGSPVRCRKSVEEAK